MHYMKIIISIIIIIILYIIIKKIINKIKYILHNKKISTSKSIKHDNDIVEKVKAGEDAIANFLEKIDIYHKIVRNVYIINENKKTEIDIIFITTCGLFIIESKNFKGNIYGYDYNEKWLQYINNKRYNFNNPIIQNDYHINFLCDKLKLAKKEYFKSYIVFGENAKLKSINITKYKDVKVINTSSLIENIFTDMHKSPIVLSHEEIDKIYIELQYYCSHLNR